MSNFFQLCIGQVHQDPGICPSVLECCTMNPMPTTTTTTTTTQEQECFVCEDGSLREHFKLQLKVIGEMTRVIISKHWLSLLILKL